MESVRESLNLVSIADHLNHLLLFGFEDAVPLDDLPYTFLVFGEGSVLCVNLRLVRDLDFLWVVF